MCSDIFTALTGWKYIYLLKSRLHVGDFCWSCEHLFMDQQFVVIFCSFVHCSCLGRLGEAVFLLLLVAISVRFATVVIDGANEQKKKKTIARYVYIRGFAIFTALCCVFCCCCYIHVCFHAAFHSVLKHNTIQYLCCCRLWWWQYCKNREKNNVD